jgi:DNA-binding MarR family transcriptional regulator
VGAVTEDRPQVPLARLFAMAYRDLIDGLHERLAERGWRDVRPSFGFVLLAARAEPVTITEVAALMGTSKQAASKLAASIVGAGYLEPSGGTADSRERPLRLSRAGTRLLRDVEAVYAELEGEWAEVIGSSGLTRLRRDLTKAVAATHGGRLPAVRPPS